MTETSIITITRNNRSYLTNFFKALFENTDPKRFELILFDNASTESDRKYAEDLCHQYRYERDAQIRFVKNEKMKSFAANCNVGSSMAEGGFLMFLNDDTEVQPKWLDHLIDSITHDLYYEGERIGIVSPKMYFPNGNIQHCGIAFHKADMMPGHIWWNKKKRNDPAVMKPKFFQAVTGGAMFIRRRTFVELGGFDEVYAVCAYEDIDLCLRAKEANLAVKYEPRAEILHHESVTQKKFDPAFRQEYFVKNTKTFLDRWRDKIDADYSRMTNGAEQ